MTTNPTSSDLLAQADALAARIDARLTALRGDELPADADGVSPSPRPLADDPAIVIRSALEKVRSRRFSAGRDREDLEKSLAEDTMFSDEYKRQQAENFAVVQQQEAEAVAALEWRRVEALEADLEARHAEAERSVDQRVDHARVAGITRDLEARLALGASPTGMSARGDQITLAEKLIAEAEASGDPDRMRATRQALSSTVASLASSTGAGTDDHRARDLRRRLRDLEGLERGEADQIAQMRDAVAVRKHELAQEISLLETTITGAKRHVFDPITPWDKRVFGKQPEPIIMRVKQS
jgi:hypothetical protein